MTSRRGGRGIQQQQTERKNEGLWIGLKMLGWLALLGMVVYMSPKLGKPLKPQPKGSLPITQVVGMDRIRSESLG